MRYVLVVASLMLGAGLSAGCGEDDPKCDTADCLSEDGGSGGKDAAGGSGGTESEGGSGGSAGSSGEGGGGGSGGTPTGNWQDHRPDECTQEQSSQVINTNLFIDIVTVHVSPPLDEGFSASATVRALEENMTVIRLETDAGKSVTITWPGVIGGYAVGSKVVLEQSGDWTIVRRPDNKLLSAMYKRRGEIPAEKLSPLPLGAPDLRFAMQCNISKANNCTMDAVALLSGEGDDLEIFESGQIVHTGSWMISNRSAMQTSGCQQYIPFRSLIWVEGRP